MKTVVSLTTLLPVALVILGTSLDATTYYVSPSGSDSNSGTSTSAPFQTIQHAVGLSALAAGDTIILMDGTYTAPSSCTDKTSISAINITTGGSSGNPITLKAMNKWGAALDAGDGSGNPKCFASIFFQTNSANYWVIQDLEIKNGYYGGIWSNNNGSAQNVVVKGNHIHNIGRYSVSGTLGEAGVYVAPAGGGGSASSMTIDGNLIHDVGRTNDVGNSYDHGIYSYGTTTAVNNIFYNMWSGWAIQAAAGFQGTIANNTFYGPNEYNGGSSKDGQIVLWNQAGGNVNIQNNIFDGPFSHALANVSFSLPTGATCSVDHNIAYITTGDKTMNVPSACTSSSNTVRTDSTDPLEFVSTSVPDFHIQSGSPAKDAGTTVTAASTDFDGTARPQGTYYDLGAYEFIPNLEGWWRFYNNANDSSGNGNDGSPQNSPTYGTGETGASISLNGTSQYVTVSDSSSLDMTDNITVAFWINPSSTSGSDPRVVSKNYDWEVKLNSGVNPQFSSGGKYAQMNYSVSANTWVHVAFTFSSGTVNGYINGSSVSFSANTYSGGETFSSYTYGVNIGAYVGGSNYFPGLVDDVRIYNRALSATEISSLYSATK